MGRASKLVLLLDHYATGAKEMIFPFSGEERKFAIISDIFWGGWGRWVLFLF